MKHNDKIAEQIRINPLSQSISSLNKRGISIDSFRNNKRTIDSLRSSGISGPKKIINIGNESHNNSINPNINITPIESSPVRSQKTNCLNMFLPPQSDKYSGKKTLVLDLDETLVHSDFTKYKDKPDMVINVTVENKNSNIYVLIRPGTEVFLTKMSKLYEIVIFTASISKYAEPLMNKLDQKKLVAYTLFREHCTIINNIAVKDLKRLNRDLKNVILVDNNPTCYSLNPENGFPIKAWLDDQNDRELFKLLPIFEFLSEVPDVRDYIRNIQINNLFSYTKAANLMNNYYSNKKKSDELNKSFQCKSRVNNEDNTAYFNSFNQYKGNEIPNCKYIEDNQKNIKLINSVYHLNIDPLIKENINSNDANNYNMLKLQIQFDESANSNNNSHYRKSKNARHQYNLSDSKLVYQDKRNNSIADSQRNDNHSLNESAKPSYNYHIKHVSIVLDNKHSPNRINSKSNDNESLNEFFNKKNSSEVLAKQKQFINTPKDTNSHISLNPHVNKKKTKEEINSSDISKEQYNNFLLNNQNKYKSPIIINNNPYSLRQDLAYLNKLNDNEKKTRFESNFNFNQSITKVLQSKKA